MNPIGRAAVHARPSRHRALVLHIDLTALRRTPLIVVATPSPRRKATAGKTSTFERVPLRCRRLCASERRE